MAKIINGLTDAYTVAYTVDGDGMRHGSVEPKSNTVS